MNNQERLQQLFEQDSIRANNSPLFKTQPPIGENLDVSRIRGMLLGLAIGDALGNTSESMNPGRRQHLYGEIKNYLPNRHANGQAIGLPSDDTQLAFWTLEHLLENAGLNPELLAHKFMHSGQIFGIGATVRGFLKNLTHGKPWWACGPHSAGNGALMRIVPILLVHLQDNDSNLWVDGALATLITHNEPAAIACSVAFLGILRDLLEMDRAPEPTWWLSRFLQLAADIEGDTQYQSRSPAFHDFRGSLCEFVETEIRAALHKNWSTLEACNHWYSGAYLLETMPSVLFILARHAHEPEQAMIRAVNDTRDNDTVAAIVGAALGVLHGEEWLPPQWVEALSGKTRRHDDGRVFELIDNSVRLATGEPVRE